MAYCTALYHEVPDEEITDLPDGRIVCVECLGKLNAGEIQLDEIPEDEIPEELQDEVTELSLLILSGDSRKEAQ